MNKVKMGVVGAGTISLRGILPHLSQEDIQDRVTVQAICDPFPGRAEAAAERFGVASAFSNYQDMLEQGDIDAVTLASPIGLHYEQGRLALEAGKHIHFNKTMTTTVAEANELIALATERKLKMVASPGEVLRPQVQQVKTLINEGAIGTLVWAACGSAFGNYHEAEEERQGKDVLSNINPAWYYRKPGGGPLYDMTVYNLHALTSILGSAKRVTAMSGTRIPERAFNGEKVVVEADDNSTLLIDFGDSVFAFAFGTAAGNITNSVSGNYYGTKGVINGYELNGQAFKYPGIELAEQAPGWTGEQWVLPHVTGPHQTIEEQHVFEDVMQLVDLVLEDKPTPVTPEHARHVIDIIESAYRAADSGQTQTLSTQI